MTPNEPELRGVGRVSDDAPSTGFRLIHGGGEIAGFVERLAAMAREGLIDVIAVAIVESDGMTGSGLAARECDTPFPRILGAIEVLKHDILTGRLGFE